LILRDYEWKHLSSKFGDLPSTNGGHEQTSSLVADLDKEGINDFIITDRSVSPLVVWYRYGKGKWDKYIIDNSLCRIEAGNAVLDIDYDILSKPYNWDTPRLDIFINESKK
jgi:hypothetical protein